MYFEEVYYTLKRDGYRSAIEVDATETEGGDGRFVYLWCNNRRDFAESAKTGKRPCWIGLVELTVYQNVRILLSR